MTLREWLARPEVREVWTIQRLADVLGRNRVSVSRMVNGHTLPRAGDVVRIAEITGGAVEPNDWYPGWARARARLLAGERRRAARVAEAGAANGVAEPLP